MSVSDNVESNRLKCEEYIHRAVSGGAQLVVFPEFSHLAPMFVSSIAAWDVALHDAHPFLRSMRDAAHRHAVWLAVNGFERGPYPQVLDTTFLIDPAGTLVGRYHKHLLFGPERNWITPGRDGYPVFNTPLGRLGLYTCMDGLIPEPARCLAVGGAQVLINCLNSAGPDEPDFYIPLRAMENGVWIVAANKVGDIPRGMAPRYIGGSCIVRPDGSTLARAEDGETIVYGDITLDDSPSPRLAGRRPALYTPLFRDPAGTVHVAAPAPVAGAELVAGASAPVFGCWTIWQAGSEIHVTNPEGTLVASYRPPHPGPGDAPVVVDTPWGRLGLSGLEDLWFPEASRMLALEGADLLIHLGDWHPWLLVARAAENRMAALAVGPQGYALARIGPLHSDPHWRARTPELESGMQLDTHLDLSEARSKADQLSGRIPEDCGRLVE